ncbi:uncharacterized protein [Malus domestica]|uniref:uncharacterized protein n=1 Tax=Malus domestica TaxID=3750 RepID=UPI0010AA14A7|nr:uncharacterized protein LOC114827590 [Malus domestica]
MVANQLYELCDIVGLEATRLDLVPSYVRLQRDNEAEVRIAAAGKVILCFPLLVPSIACRSIRKSVLLQRKKEEKVEWNEKRKKKRGSKKKGRNKKKLVACLKPMWAKGKKIWLDFLFVCSKVGISIGIDIGIGIGIGIGIWNLALAPMEFCIEIGIGS